MNDDFFNKVATAQAVESPQIGQDSFFDHVANYQKYEPDFKIREAESVFDFVRNNSVFDFVRNNAENEDAEAIIGITDFISKRYNVSAKNAIDNIDTYLADYMGKAMPKKEAWQQIKDGYTEGRITDKLGRLYNRLMYAKDDNQRKSIEFEIEKLEARMPSRVGNATTGITPWIESASNLFGTMVRPLMISTMVGLGTAGLGSIPAVASFASSAPMIANIGARVLSMAPTFNETRKVETGLIYKDMIENGVPEQIAKKNAIAHGMIAGALETASIEVLLARFPFMKKIAQNAFMRLTARERMTQGAVKAIGKIIADNALSLPIGIVSETATEVLQEYSAVHFEKRADLQSIDDKELAKIMADKQGEFEMYFDEEFRKAKKDYYVSDEYAQEVKDRIWDVAKQTAKGMTVFGLIGGGFNATTDIVSNAKTVGKYKNTYEKLEQLKTDAEKLRDERNKLRDELNADPTNAEKKAAYEKANEELASRESELNMTDEEKEYAELSGKTELTEDEYDRLVDLDAMIQVKRDFEKEENPNYTKEPQDIQHPAPQTVDVGEKRFREIVKSYTPDVTEEQTDEIINLLNARARSLDQDLDTYLNNTFQAEMANYTTEDTATITENGKERTVRFKGNVDFAKDGKAIITLTQNADFTTWVHEIGHIFRRQIGGDMLAEAEKHYGVQDGVWTVEAEERFTEDFTEYLRTRRAPNSTLEKMFRIIADALNDIYDRFRARGQVSDDIARVFDEMLGDGQSAFADPYSNVDSMLYQIVGEKAARQLDLQEEVTTRMDNLQKAKEMKDKNYGSMYIRYATGWEWGKDKKWRYEIPDIKLTNPVFESDEKIMDKEDEYLDLRDRQKALLRKQNEWTDADRKELKKIQDDMKRVDAEMRKMRQDKEQYIKSIMGEVRPITEFVDGDVFKAYPHIKNMVGVEFRPESRMEGAYGLYYEADDKIAVSASLVNNPEKLLSVLAHEIQHAVQAEEGFYRGGGESLFTTTDLAEQQKKMANLAPKEREALERKINRAGMTGKTKYVDLSPFGINEFVEPYEAYMRVAGEVEARNVEERLFKSDAYRRKHLLRDTEDRTRTQQISVDKLYQLEEDTYRTATRNGQYVPDNILANMRGAEWVEDELEAREDFRKDALNYDSYEAFLEAQIKSGINRSDDYFENIWNTATEVYPGEKAMLPLLTRRMVERIIYTLKRISERENRKLGWPWNELIKNYSKDHMISEDTYKSLMAQMKSDPDAYIELISECFKDQAEFEEMMKSLWLHPDLEVERIKELERAIKGDKKLAETRISKLEDRIDRIRQNYREREMYKKLVRAIFRKPAKMCDVQIAMQIQAIQAGLSPTSMRETTRLKLELELQNTTDERRKAKIRNLMERKSLRDMTLLEVAQVADMIAQLRHEGVQKRMDQLLAKKEERLGIIDGLGEDLDVSDTLDKTGSIEAKDNKGSLINRMKGYWWDINRIAEDMGPHWQAFFADRVGQAYQDELRNVARRRQAFLDKVKELKITTLSDIEKIDGAEGEKTYTHDILLHWYLCKQNEDSYAALLYGNFKGDPEDTARMQDIERTIDEGISRLSDEEIQLAEWMMNSFSGEDRGRLWEVFMEVENRCPEMVTRYFPMKRQLDHISDVQADPLVDLGERTPAGRVAVRKGFSWDRIHNINWKNQKSLKLGATSTYMQAIQDQEHYIAFAQLSKDMKYCYEKVADKVIAKYGKNFYDDLNMWIDRVTNPNAYKARYAQQNVFMKALSNSVAGALAGNVVTMIKQAPSMLFFLPYCDAGSLAKSVYDFATDHKKMTEFAKEKSPYLANRNIDDFLTRLADELQDPNSKYRKAKEVTSALLKPISWIDEFACVVGWNAVYSSEMGKGATEAEAIAKANEALVKTQPQATAIFSPQAYNASSDLMRTMLVFTRQANQIFQMITADIGHLAAEKQFKQIVSMGFVLGLNALVMGWISRKFAGYGDDDDSAVEDITKDILANLANNIPVVGPTIVPMIQRSAYTSSGYVNPISEMLNKTHRAIYRSIRMGQLDNDAAMRLITDAMGVAGLPKVMTWRAYKALKDEDIWTLFIGSPLGGNNGGK